MVGYGFYQITGKNQKTPGQELPGVFLFAIF